MRARRAYECLETTGLRNVVKYNRFSRVLIHIRASLPTLKGLRNIPGIHPLIKLSLYVCYFSQKLIITGIGNKFSFDVLASDFNFFLNNFFLAFSPIFHYCVNIIKKIMFHKVKYIFDFHH